jgi:hypothetical protein
MVLGEICNGKFAAFTSEHLGADYQALQDIDHIKVRWPMHPITLQLCLVLLSMCLLVPVSSDVAAFMQAATSQADITRSAIHEPVQAVATDFQCRLPPGQLKEKKHIAVLQGEIVVTNLENEPATGVVVSSDQATTCVIIAAHCELSQSVLIAHLDSFSRSIADDLQCCLSQMQCPSLYMVGAYNDCKRTGIGTGHQKLLQPLMEFLHETVMQQIELRLFCCCALNTSPERKPLVQGLAYDTATRTAFIPCPDMHPGVP